MDEKTYLEQNPDKHKMNLYTNRFFEVVVVNGKKCKKFNLDNCVAKFNDDTIFGEVIDTKFTVDPDDKEAAEWEIREIKNVDYIKKNALVSIGDVDGGVICIILGYINERGTWVGQLTSSSRAEGSAILHKIDDGILNSLPQIFEEDSTVVDFGCGNADYIKHLISEGFKCEAYDGNPSTVEMTNGIGEVLDLSKDFDLNKKFDYVISLEVAEHIPKEYEETYVDNLIRHTGFYLITSWAVKGQGGDGHVNEQDEEYVLNMYKEKGMKYNKEVSEALRSVAILGWFKETIFVFEKG